MCDFFVIIVVSYLKLILLQNNNTMRKNMKSFLLAGTFVLSALIFIVACGGSGKDPEIQKLKEETIAVHDEIMPQVATFDRHTVKIDTILINLDSLYQANPSLDTAGIRHELATLKDRLESATDQMMTWMMEFEDDPQGMSSEEVKAYYESELAKITKMRDLFNDVSKESADKLANY